MDHDRKLRKPGDAAPPIAQAALPLAGHGAAASPVRRWYGLLGYHRRLVHADTKHPITPTSRSPDHAFTASPLHPCCRHVCQFCLTCWGGTSGYLQSLPSATPRSQ